MILDSSYLFGLLSGDPDAQRVALQLEADGAMQWLPTPVIAEVSYGAAVARPDSPGELVGEHLHGYPRLEVDVEVARTAGDLLAAVDDAEAVGANAAYVGAMATILDEPVLTAEREAFDALGVDVRTY